jgi:ABC-2 type transport system ATP-binding protein
MNHTSTPQSRTAPRVLVVGAGLGGLTAAVALRRLGIDAVILEQAPEVRAVGAGISLWPNAVNVLRRLGVGDVLETLGSHIVEGDIRDWRGEILHRSSTDQLEERFGAPLIMVHRSILHTALVEALGEEAIRLKSRCVALHQDSEGVEVKLADGTAVRGHVAIGADGLNSVVRAITLGDGPPRPSGLTAWRAVTAVDSSLASRLTVGESWGRGCLFGVQRIQEDEFYWYAAARSDSGGSTTGKAEKRQLLRRFENWHPPIKELIETTPEQAILRHDLYDRPLPHSLAFGRVALLGDAAHPMLPNIGQGACQAIQDGETVAHTLAHTPTDPVSALDRYSTSRLPAVSAAVTLSRRMSRAAHLKHPIPVGLRNTLLRITPAETTLTKLGPILHGGVSTPTAGTDPRNRSVPPSGEPRMAGMREPSRRTSTEPVPTIEIRDLTKDYDDVRAVDHLSFRVTAGTITGFLGPNGSGKSTTLRALVGLVEPTSGLATIRGRRYRDLADPLSQVGTMLEATAHPARTARNHLRVIATEAGKPRRRVDQLLDLVELSAAADRRVGGFSLGMKQRLGLATALMSDPQILVLDEPANGLDPQGIRWLRDFLRTLARQGRTILLSSHVLAEVAQTVDEVVVIDRGRLVTHQPLSQLTNEQETHAIRVGCQQPAVLEAALGAAGLQVRSAGPGELTVTGTTAEAIGQLAFDNNVVIHEIRTITPDLEETFLRLTSHSGQEVQR